jgi:hypothetical protein
MTTTLTTLVLAAFVSNQQPTLPSDTPFFQPICALAGGVTANWDGPHMLMLPPYTVKVGGTVVVRSYGKKKTLHEFVPQGTVKHHATSPRDGRFALIVTNEGFWVYSVKTGNEVLAVLGKDAFAYFPREKENEGKVHGGVDFKDKPWTLKEK